MGGANTVAKYIGSQDTTYSSLFLHDSWREILEKAEPSPNDVTELVSRVEQYVNSCGSTEENLMHLPIAEAMVTYKEKRFVAGSKYKPITNVNQFLHVNMTFLIKYTFCST